MKTLKSLLLAVAVMVTITSCQKEESLESGIPGTPSSGTLKDTLTGDCLWNTVNGIYVATTALDSSDNILIEVNVLSPGAYTILSNTVNGYYFKGVGYFNNIGVQIITLKGYGAPLAAGIDSFSITYNNTHCDAFVTVLPSGASGTSVFTLGGSGGPCTGALLQGFYIQGVPLNATVNQAIINVDVTATGTYFINTAIINGISFSGSGTFIITGPQTITLHGNGIPTASGSVDFSITAGTNTCDFVVDVLAPVVPAVYTLSSTAGNCSNATVSGDYVMGTALGVANTVDLDVDVTVAGSWTVNTAAVNGITFSGSGIFITTGVTTITLQAAGTPTTLGVNTIPVTAGVSSCSFPVTVVNTIPPPCSPTNNTADLSGVTTISFTTVTGASGAGDYVITGSAGTGGVDINFAGTAQPTAGTYNIQPLAGPFNPGDVTVTFDASGTLWYASTGLVYVTVTAGKASAVLCNVALTATVAPFNSNVSAKLTEQ